MEINMTKTLNDKIEQVFGVRFTNQEVQITKDSKNPQDGSWTLKTPTGYIRGICRQSTWDDHYFAGIVCDHLMNGDWVRYGYNLEKDPAAFISHHTEWLMKEGDENHRVFRATPRVPNPAHPGMKEMVLMETKNSTGEWIRISKMNSYFRAILGVEDSKASTSDPIYYEEHDDNKVSIIEESSTVLVPCPDITKNYLQQVRNTFYDPNTGIIEVYRVQGCRNKCYYEKSQVYRAKSGRIMRKILSKTPPEWLMQIAKFGVIDVSPYLSKEGTKFLEQFEELQPKYIGQNVFVQSDNKTFIHVVGGWILLTAEVLDTFDIPEETIAEINIYQSLF